MFGGVAALGITQAQYDLALENGFMVDGFQHGLNDLWHWNGDVQHPVWTEIERQSQQELQPTAWPPQWQAPLGWVSDADGGELWLAGDSGVVSTTGQDAGSLAIEVCYSQSLSLLDCLPQSDTLAVNN